MQGIRVLRIIFDDLLFLTREPSGLFDHGPTSVFFGDLNVIFLANLCQHQPEADTPQGNSLSFFFLRLIQTFISCMAVVMVVVMVVIVIVILGTGQRLGHHVIF